MNVIISYRDKHIRKEIAGFFKENYPNSDILGFDDVLLAAKEAYANSTDVIVMGVEGIKLIPMLKKAGKDMTIVILADNNLHMDEAYSTGADAYVTKPYSKADIFAAVEGTASLLLL